MLLQLFSCIKMYHRNYAHYVLHVQMQDVNPLCNEMESEERGRWVDDRWGCVV